MPELAGPQPVESREAYDKAVADYNQSQLTGANLPPVAYDQPGQIIAPEQLPDPLVNIRAGFAPQDITSVVVASKDEVLTHPNGLELDDPLRTVGGDAYKAAAKFAADNADSYDEQKRLSELSAPQRDQLQNDKKADSGSPHESAPAAAHEHAPSSVATHESSSAKSSARPSKS